MSDLISSMFATNSLAKFNDDRSKLSNSNYGEYVPKPNCFQNKLLIKDKLLMIPGPTNMHPRVQEALSNPIIAHTESQFFELMRQIQKGIRYLFQTKNDYTFTLTGSATIAMETAICNLLVPGQRLLSLVHGHWGVRVASMGQRLGAQVHCIHAPKIGEIFSLQNIEDALCRFKPHLMYVCHGDSSVGTLQPLDGIGELCHKYNCLLMVDAVVSLCTTSLQMDYLGIDVLFSGAQKALSGPPGISLISFSSKAVAVFKDRTKISPVSSYYMDLQKVADAWGTGNGSKYVYHYTPAINLMYGLREAISLVVEEGLSNIVQRHKLAKDRFELLFENSGIKFLVKCPQSRLPGIMSILIPDHVDGSQIIKQLNENNNILIGGSLLVANGNTPNFWRVGYLGINATKQNVDRVCTALLEAVKSNRYRFQSHL